MSERAARQCVISQDCGFAAIFLEQEKKIDVFKIVTNNDVRQHLQHQYTVQLLILPSDIERRLSFIGIPQSFSVSSGHGDYVAVSWLGICHVYKRGTFYCKVFFDGQCYFLPNNDNDNNEAPPLLTIIQPNGLRLYKIKKYIRRIVLIRTMNLLSDTAWVCFHREFTITCRAKQLIQLWSIEEGRLLMSFKSDQNISLRDSVAADEGNILMAVSPKRHSMAIYRHNKVSIYDIESGLQVNEWIVHRPVFSINFLNDVHLALISYGQHLQHQIYTELWDMLTGSCMMLQEQELFDSNTNSNGPTSLLSVSNKAKQIDVMTTISSMGFCNSRWVLVFTTNEVKSISATLQPITSLLLHHHLTIPHLLFPGQDSKEPLYYEFHHPAAISPSMVTYILDNHRILCVGVYSVQLWMATKKKSAIHINNATTSTTVPSSCRTSTTIDDYTLHKLLYIFCLPEIIQGRNNSSSKIDTKVKNRFNSIDCNPLMSSSSSLPSINAKRIKWRTNKPAIQFFDNSWVSVTMTDGTEYTFCMNGNFWSKSQHAFIAMPVLYQINVYSKIKGWKSRTFNHIFQQTIRITNHSIQHQPKFFETPAGNIALAGLVQYPNSSKILEKLLFANSNRDNGNDEANLNSNSININVKPVSIITRYNSNSNSFQQENSYDGKNQQQQQFTAATSILAIAATYDAYDDVRILVNYMLQSTRMYHPGYLVTFTNALPLLCSKCPDMVLDWMHQLSYIPVTPHCPILEVAPDDAVLLQQPSRRRRNIATRLSELWGFSTTEQFTGSNSDISSIQSALCQESSRAGHYQQHNNRKPHLATLCVFPLIHYSQHYNKRGIQYHHNNDDKNQYTVYPSSSSVTSLFVQQALSGRSEVFRQGEPAMEAMLIYKWRTFGRRRFAFVCIIYIANQVLFSVNVAFPKNNNTTTLTLMLIVSAFLVTQETRHIWFCGLDYFRLFYNYISLAAVLLPIAGAIVILSGHEYPVDACAISVFVLWLHSLVRLRVIRDLGIVFEMVVQITKRMSSLALLLLIVLCTFTHTFIVLLFHVDDMEFVQSFTGTVDKTIPLSMINNPASANRFRNVAMAAKTVWFFLHGRWDILQNRPVENRPLVSILSVIFSLSTTIILLNVLIALMTSIAAEVKRKGKRVWIAYLAESLAEIELFWCFPWERHNQRLNPTYIYYIAYIKTIREYDTKRRYQHLHNEN